MTRRIAAQIALLAFACALVAGLIRGNSATTVLSRALLALVAGFAIGQVAALTARVLIRDHLQRRKVAIDRAHVAALSGPAGSAEIEGTSNQEAG
jgi:hypothetical protein